MTTKERKLEAIREAYGEQYEALKPFINENGWLKWCNECPINPVISDYDYSNEIGGHRPKSLAGIESNNGWVSINSASDLPKEPCTCHIYVGSEVRLDFFTGLEFKVHLLDSVTHYKIITKPKPPIF